MTSTGPTPTLAPQPSSAATPLSILSLVFGIVGILGAQWLLAVAALVLGLVARGREPHARPLANWGFALGLVGTIGWALVATVGAAIFFYVDIWCQ